ncbi:hypothetical protein SLEP1_g23361 [Rubroshorea leprosula]|uniref:Uncharacterized protein n=1 Tax=Rubroshorea leprosula TaxID=152421 RepID=A0AAV5JLC5_9ROSI|nr:hypothetical protein SLEP1_g23361 [Rubroshorea leprosula]
MNQPAPTLHRALHPWPLRACTLRLTAGLASCTCSAPNLHQSPALHCASLPLHQIPSPLRLTAGLTCCSASARYSSSRQISINID